MTADLRRVQPLAPGEYSVRRRGGAESVAVACPCCGAVRGLDWPYRVAQTGDVQPEWLCDVCGWSGELRLVDFAEELVGA